MAKERSMGFSGSNVEEPISENKYNTILPRILAGILDIVILQVIFVLPSYFIMKSLHFKHIIFFNYGIWVLPYGYSILFHWKFGKTIGKHILNLSVNDSITENKISFIQALKRDLIPLALVLFLIIAQIVVFIANLRNIIKIHNSMEIFMEWIFVLLYSLEILTAVFNRKHRSVYDFFAGTVVVKN